MRWMKVLLPAAAAALLLPACPSRCREACDNVKAICAEQFAAENKVFDADKCAEDCDANLDGCKNMDEQETCVAETTACAELEKCPGCLQ